MESLNLRGGFSLLRFNWAAWSAIVSPGLKSKIKWSSSRPITKSRVPPPKCVGKLTTCLFSFSMNVKITKNSFPARKYKSSNKDANSVNNNTIFFFDCCISKFTKYVTGVLTMLRFLLCTSYLMTYPSSLPLLFNGAWIIMCWREKLCATGSDPDKHFQDAAGMHKQ